MAPTSFRGGLVLALAGLRPHLNPQASNLKREPGAHRVAALPEREPARGARGVHRAHGCPVPGPAGGRVQGTPLTLHPQPYTLNLTPFNLHP